MLWGKVGVSIFLWAALAALVASCTKRPIFGTLGTLFAAGVFGLGSYLKMKTTTQVVVPADVYFLAQPSLLAEFVPGGVLVFWSLVTVLTVLAAIFIWLTWRGQARLHWAARALLFGQGLAGIATALVVLGWLPGLKGALGQTLNVSVATWRPTETAHEQGLLLSFLAGVPASVIRRPPHLELADSLTALEQLARPMPEDGEPHAKTPPMTAAGDRRIVVLMLESWIDPSWWRLQYNRDPTPNFHALQSQSTNLRLVSPVVGGGTANVEFELLSGLAIEAFPQGSYPYLNFIRRPVFSLPAAYRAAGFRTVALHNYSPDMWHRNVVYPFMGFDSFVSQADLDPSKLQGYINWPRDDHLYDMLREVLAKPGPTFALGISMVTHAPYDAAQLPPEQRIIRIVSQPSGALLNQQMRDAVEVFLNKQYQADLALGRFLKALDSLQNVTLVVFGDHQPGVTSYAPDQVDWEKALAGFDFPGKDPAAARLYLVPALIKQPSGAAPPELAGRVLSPNCLTSTVLALGGVALPPYFTYLRNLCALHPVYSNDKGIDAIGIDLSYQNLVFDFIFNSDALRAVEFSSGPADRSNGI